MTEIRQNNSPTPIGLAEFSATMSTLCKQVDELQSDIDALQVDYLQAANHLPTKVADDVRSIHDARIEVEQITSILQGTELFGRYAQDADHHLRIADRWRRGAVGILILAPAVEVFLALATQLDARGRPRQRWCDPGALSLCLDRIT